LSVSQPSAFDTLVADLTAEARREQNKLFKNNQ